MARKQKNLETKRRERVKKPPVFPSVLEYRFKAGPYSPPLVNVGVTIHDEYLGEVTIAGTTEALIPWPAHLYSRGRHEGLMPILTGDLVRAVCEEEEQAVAHYWGVTRHMVNQWKAAIAGTSDSNHVFLQLALKRHDPEFRRKYGYR